MPSKHKRRGETETRGPRENDFFLPISVSPDHPVRKLTHDSHVPALHDFVDCFLTGCIKSDKESCGKWLPGFKYPGNRLYQLFNNSGKTPFIFDLPSPGI
jgi:hypothetical protein